MSSSTSNFRTELKVLCVVALLLAVCELGVRRLEKLTSRDLKVPTIAWRLAEGEGVRVLVLGNSLVREGLRLHLFRQELSEQSVENVRVEFVSSVNTLVGDWYYVFKHHFVDAKLRPDVLVVCFALNHLQDAPIQRTLIARYHSGATDIPQIFVDDVRDFDNRVGFLLSAVFASYANRSNVTRRFLRAFVPHYTESAQRINKALLAGPRAHREEVQPTYQRLEKLIRMAESHGVRVILVAMPVGSSYEIDARVESLAKDAGTLFIDTRVVPGLGDDGYIDGMHMNNSGAAIYSRFLAHQLAQYLKTSEGGSSK